MILSKTPLRISFAGGGTDLPAFYQSNGFGSVLSSSINSYIYVIVKEHAEVFSERIRLNYSEVELVDDVSEVKNPIIRECLKFLEIHNRIYIATIADAPGSSGLGSSSSFCVGLLNALYQYLGESVPISKLAEEAAHIEMNILNRPIGKQDHYAAAYGGINCFNFYSNDHVEVEPINPSRNVMHQLFDGLQSFWLNKQRPAETVLKEQNDNTEENTKSLLTLRDQVNEMEEILRKETLDLEAFGKLVHEGWAVKKNLASGISSNHFDQIYDDALTAGSYGGKISGAGGGGFLNLFTNPNKHQAVKDKLSNYSLTPYQFRNDSCGTRVMVV